MLALCGFCPCGDTHSPKTYNFGDGRIVWIPVVDSTTQDTVKVPQPQFRLHDHLGNTVVYFHDKNNDGCITTEADTNDPDSLEVIQRFWYYPFGMAMQGLRDWATEPGQWYRYNGKERDTVSGWYEYGFRWYIDEIGRFAGVDPLADQRAWVSPYNYVQNNPILRIDPTGALDTIKANKNGIITEVIKTPLVKQPFGKWPRNENVFLSSETGQEFALNDLKNPHDLRIFTKKDFGVGDQLFQNLSSQDMFDLIVAAGFEPTKLLEAGNYVGRYSVTKKLSLHGKADFPMVLWDSNKYGLSTAGTGDGGTEVIGIPFKIAESNTLYNPSDAGQFIWGAWMRANRFTRFQTWAGSNYNEASRGGDARGDQRAIFSGWRYMDAWMKL